VAARTSVKDSFTIQLSPTAPLYTSKYMQFNIRDNDIRVRIERLFSVIREPTEIPF
jgi:hypothetical protein